VTWPHERPFAHLHDRLPFTPIHERPSPLWPGGARLAVWIVPNVEHYEYLPPPGAQDPYPRAPHPDIRKFSYHDFGNRVGFWRMLEVLDRWSIPCTTSLNVAVLDHYPQVAEAMASRGWEFMSHGLYNTRYLTGLSENEERDFLEEVDQVLYRHTGQHFAGMLGPNITGNPWTPDLMAERGMRYHADWVHDERPSPLLTRSGGPFVALPYTYSLNDAPLFMRSHREGAAYERMCVDQILELCQGDANIGRMMCLSLHPFTIGQPHRVQALNRVLEHLRSRNDIWIATGSQIVDHYLATAYEQDLDMANAHEVS
jgi:allantoinase